MTYAMPDDERLARLRLARTQGIGPITFRRLIERYQSAIRAVDLLPELAKRGGKKTSYDPVSKGEAEDELARLDAAGGTIVAWGEASYPAQLAALEDAPCILSVLGDAACLAKNSVGIVGSRNASLQGRKITEKIAGDLGRSEVHIVSGLARGIDTAAHAASLDTGTTAVLAGGVDVVYPAENKALYEQIIEKGGAIVAENAWGMEPMARHFPRRNRIISGLSQGVLVVEATLKSGSLITAHMAADQGREVFAIPGHPFDPRASGPNALIRDGATLVSGAADIMDVLSRLGGGYRVQEPDAIAFEVTPDEPDDATLENARAVLDDLLSSVPTGVDELIREAMMPTPAIQTVLLELELAGRLVRHPGNRVSACLSDEAVDKIA